MKKNIIITIFVLALTYNYVGNNSKIFSKKNIVLLWDIKSNNNKHVKSIKSDIINNPKIKSSGYNVIPHVTDDKTVIYDIVSKYNPNIFITIGTPATILASKNNLNTPIIFSAVSDANIINAKKKHITGVIDKISTNKMIKLIDNFILQKNTIGILYNVKEPNSKYFTLKLETKITKHLNARTIKYEIKDTETIKKAMQFFMGKVDFIILPQDNTIYSNLKHIFDASYQNKTPLILTTPITDSDIAIASVGYDYNGISKMTTDMVIDFLEKDKQEIAISKPKKINTFANHRYISFFNIKLKDDYHFDININ